MISSLIDELNKLADEWNGSNMFELARMCREAADTIWQLRDDLQRANAENAKLRVERDEWHRVAASKQDIIDHMRNANSENSELRELVSRLIMCAGTINNKDVLEYHPLLDGCGFDCTVNGERCSLAKMCDQARELGVEVKE